MFLNNILDIKWVTAENATVYDDKGKDYIDFTSGIFAANIGHNNRYVTDAIKRQAHLIHCYTYGNELRERYIAELCEFTGFEDAALFCSGTEATEAAWKMARNWTGKWGVIGMHHAFHGKTFGAQVMASKIPSQYYSMAHDKNGMIIMEPYTAFSANFREDKVIQRIRGMVNEYELLLTVDEIQAGFGRTGKLFGYQHYDYLTPNLVCVGKGLGNGFPISAVLGPKKIISEPAMDLSSTHGGNPLACAVGLAVIKYFKDNGVLAEAERKGKILHDALATFPVMSAGKGMVAALWLDSKDRADMLVKAAAEMGLLLVHTGRETVKIGPPLTIPEHDLKVGLEILERVVTKVMDKWTPEEMQRRC